jgi:hypothetical protein
MAPLPHWLTIIFSGIAVVGVLTTVYVAFFKPKGEIMVAQTNPPNIGHDVHNSGGGVGQEIINNGPGNGGEVSVAAPAGSSVVGTRVIQNGPGTGMRVIQNGPGTGFKSTVTIK